MTLINQPIGRFDWDRLVQRAEMPFVTKAFAWLMSQHADAEDGDSAFPGENRLADISGYDVRVVRGHLATLRSLGLIERVATPRTYGHSDEYQLTVPGTATAPLVMRLDPDGRRLTPKQPRRRSSEQGRTGSTDPVDNTRTGSLDPVENPPYRIQESGTEQDPEGAYRIPEAPVPDSSCIRTGSRNPPINQYQSSTTKNPGSPQVGTSPVAKITERTSETAGWFHPAEPRRAQTELAAGHAAALATLAALPGSSEFILRLARRELRALGHPEPDDALVAIHAADIATRPETRSA